MSTQTLSFTFQRCKVSTLHLCHILPYQEKRFHQGKASDNLSTKKKASDLTTKNK